MPTFISNIAIFKYNNLISIFYTTNSMTNNNSGFFMGNAFKLGTEMVSAVLVGTIIGFILDSWFGTKPWLIIFFFFVGAAAGILNVIKAAKKMQQK